MGDDEVNLEPDQLCREVGQPVVLPLGPAVLDGEVLTLHVAEVAKALPESLNEVGVTGRGGAAQDSEPVDFGLRLRLSAERRGEGTSQHRGDATWGSPRAGRRAVHGSYCATDGHSIT